ncbi:DUF3168 domain-containing protein [Solimicrobium silvestre]|uniref:DUF3168 domain-containing protein n=1 Tax=Solimicrobium silvestre TaxID=2099400 RepID=A0A2S9GZP3_9BURK|nr:DUF3168 domain-containing protein [Solimicrobium silvestre]PRC93086.1 hypothetical protein S2091_2172 [Solimicrobium silvestre]
MSVESHITNALNPLVDQRVYPDIAPEQTKPPYITYQQVGGASVNFLNGAIPTKRNSRFQINVWAKTRDEAAKLSKRADKALRQAQELQTTVLGEAIAVIDQETKLRGTRQDFSFWVNVT